MAKVTAGFCSISKATRFESQHHRVYLTRNNHIRVFAKDGRFDPIGVYSYQHRASALAFIRSFFGLNILTV